MAKRRRNKAPPTPRKIIDAIPPDVRGRLGGQRAYGAGFFPFTSSCSPSFDPKLRLEDGLSWLAKTSNDDPFLLVGDFALDFSPRNSARHLPLAFRGIQRLGSKEDYEAPEENGEDVGSAERKSSSEKGCASPPPRVADSIPAPVTAMIGDVLAFGAAFTDRVVSFVTPIVALRKPMPLAEALEWIQPTAKGPTYLCVDGFALHFKDWRFVRLEDGDGNTLFADGKPVLHVDGVAPATPQGRDPGERPSRSAVHKSKVHKSKNRRIRQKQDKKRERRERELRRRADEAERKNDPALIDTIPAAIRELIRDKRVRQVGFGAGPGCCCGKIESFDPPRTLDDGLGWIQKYRYTLSRAHIELEDGSRLWFSLHGMYKHEPRLAAV